MPELARIILSVNLQILEESLERIEYPKLSLLSPAITT